MIDRFKNYYRRNFWSPERYARFIGVKIGDNCLISTKGFSSEPYLIEIGNYCRIAKNVSFFTHGGLWSQRKKHGDLDYFGKRKIGNYTYVGEDAKIMAGVTIGDDVIVGAGSVVTRSVSNSKIVAGNPARVVGETLDFLERIKKYDVKSKGMSYVEKKKFLLSLEDSQFIKK